MRSRFVTVVLAVVVGGLLVTLAPRLVAMRLPGDQTGYEPVQPIAFSHRLHAGELHVDCQYCHFQAERSRHAGIPPASVCMNCHRFVTATLGAIREEDRRAKEEGRKPREVISPELARLYRALGLEAPGRPAPGATPRPIAWVRVYALPDFVTFDHRPHVLAGVGCDRCHGPVERMERVRRVRPLRMGWCVNCHREVRRTGVNGRPVRPATDCVTCHV